MIVGEISINYNGMQMEIVAYRNEQDIDIRFIDSNVYMIGVTYKQFKLGRVIYTKYIHYAEKQYNKLRGNYTKKRNNKQLKESRVGQTTKNNSDMLMTIVAYRNSSDIDVKFEDGTLVHNKSYTSFVNGTIRNPNISIKRTKKVIQVGDKATMQNGLLIECIEHGELKREKFQFIDGTVVDRANTQFKLRNIEHPKFSKCELVSTYGENTYLCTCKKCKGKHVLKLSEMKDFQCPNIK